MASKILSKVVLIGLALTLGGGLLRADDAEILMKGSDCFTCHAVSRKLVGPAYLDVAKKYKGANAAKIKVLVKKVKQGGSGNWGAVPMSPHPALSDENIEKMVRWVLSRTPEKAAVKAEAPAAVPTAVPVAAEKKEEAVASTAGAAKKKKKKAHHSMMHGEEAEEIKFGTDEEVKHLMEKQDCFGCHSGLRGDGDPEEMPWPSFTQIASKHQKKMPVEALVKKVRNGEGKLVWGKIPHPHYESLPDEALSKMVTMILIQSGKLSQPAVQVELTPEDWMRKKSDCFTCHAVDKKMTGPAYRDVAKKYAGANASQVATLVKKVKQGGAGNWGSVPMAAHGSVADAQLEKAVRWVLEQK